MVMQQYVYQQCVIMVMRYSLLFLLFVFITSAAYAYDRAVSLAPSITEIVYDLGAEDKLVGVTAFCDFPPAAQKKPSVGGYLNPSIEMIVSLHPDLVIAAKNGGAKQLVEKLEDMGITVVTVEFYSIATIVDAYQKIGRALGVEQQAEEKVRDFTEQVNNYRSACAGLQQKKVLFVRWNNPLTVVGRGSLEDEILDIINAENVTERGESRYPVYTMEAVIQSSPDIIIDASYYDTPGPAARKHMSAFWHEWPSLAAVAHDEIYILKTDFHSVPGPRTRMLLDEMAAIVHPDAYESPWGLHEKLDA